jgi:chromosomal replication initiator protein
MTPDARAFGAVLSHLRKSHPALCRQWFEELEPAGVSNGVVRIRAHTPMHRDYLQRQCLEPFSEAVRATTGHLLTVRFIGPDDEDPAPAPALSAPGLEPLPAPRQNGRVEVITPAPIPIPRPVIEPAPTFSGRRDELIVNPDNTFENFVIGPGNRLAHAAAQAVAQAVGAGEGRGYNPLFIHGGVGLGKSHLLQAICIHIRHANPVLDVYYIDCDTFMNRFYEAIQSNRRAEFRHQFRDVDVLVVDDIHFLTKRENSQEEFFHTFNSLHQHGKQLILSSDAPPEQIPLLEQRLVSRFLQGMVALIEPPDFETRVTIVKKKAQLRGLAMPDDVAVHVAACVTTNIRELEGALTRLECGAQVENRPIDMGIARGAVPDPRPHAPSELTIQTVIAVVTDFYGIRLTDLQSKKRHRSVTLPRQVCMTLARKHTRLSLQEIGGHFGGRDHTTVMHAIRAVQQKSSTDAEFRAEYTALDSKLGRSPGVKS